MKRNFTLFTTFFLAPMVGVLFSKPDLSRKRHIKARSEPVRCRDAKPIDHATTINKSGVYCLIANIKGVISIKANDVVLNLNDKIISGDMQGIIVDGAHNVHIQGGGRIENFKDTAISAQNSSNLTISGVLVSAGPIAFSFKNCAHVSMQKCVAKKCKLRIAEVQNCSDSIFEGNNFFDNMVDVGMRLSNCSSTVLSNNVITDNQGILGFIAVLFDQCSGCGCIGACISDNTQLIAGIKSLNSTRTAIKKSFLYNNTMKSLSVDLLEGIVLEGSKGDSVKNNMVEYNAISGNPDAVCIGISVRSSIVNNLASPTVQSLIKRNIMKYNTGVLRSIGLYNATTGNDNVFFNNIAQGHVENFMFFSAIYPIAVFNSSFGSFNHAPGVLENVSINH